MCIKELELLGWMVRAERKENTVYFQIYDDQDVFSATLVDMPKPVFEPWLEGYMKWDGCSNWDFTHDNYPLHFCGLDELDKFYSLMKELHVVAGELMPEYKESILWKIKNVRSNNALDGTSGF